VQFFRPNLMRLPRRFAPRNDTPHKIVRLPSVDRNDNLLYEDCTACAEQSDREDSVTLSEDRLCW